MTRSLALLIPVALLALPSAAAQTYLFRGAVGDLAVLFELDPTEATGRYGYLRTGGWLDLDGAVEPAPGGGEPTLVLTETPPPGRDGVEPAPTGTLRLVPTRDERWLVSGLEGEWRGGGRALPVRATRIGEVVERRVVQGEVEASALYPSFALAPWRVVNGGLDDGARAALEGFVAQGRSVMADGLVFGGWTHHERTHVAYLDERLLSLVSWSDEYTGGAHPNRYIATQAFVAEGEGVRALELRDLFLDPAAALEALSERVLRDLEAQGASFVGDGEGEIARLDEEALADFTLSPAGLRFLFEPYAVGAYVQGTFEVEVPWGALDAPLDPALPIP